MMVLIDNYDSFSYNLFQLIGAEYGDICVIRNDEKTVEEIRQMKPEFIVLSPGPGRPENAGICEELVRTLAGEIPILGVCLGHQAICQAFGGIVSYAEKLMHGKTSEIKLDLNSKLFRGMQTHTQVARYHSLSVQQEGFPGDLKVTAQTDTGEVMAVEHRKYPVFGLQFHPESLMTPEGAAMIRNFLRQKGNVE